MQPGIYDGIPEDQYHASPGVSQTRLTRFAEAAIKATVPIKETRNMTLGSLKHTLLLEPDTFDDKFFISTLARFDERTAAYKDEVLRAAGREIIKVAEYDNAAMMCDAARKHPVVASLLQPGLKTEQSAYWHDEATGLLCRGRLDAVLPGQRVIADIKTTTDARASEFGRSIATHRYDLQQAFYEDGMRRVGKWHPEMFFFVAIENTEPWLVACWLLQPKDVEAADAELRLLLSRYAECERTGIWPGYSDKIEQIELPHWFTSRKLAA